MTASLLQNSPQRLVEYCLTLSNEELETFLLETFPEQVSLRDSLKEICNLASDDVATNIRQPDFDAYQVETEVGDGGQSRVFRALDRKHNRKVALKLLKKVQDPQSLRLFEREKQLLAKLEHPSIARLYSSGQTKEGHPWFAMEWVEGQDLMTWAKEHSLNDRLNAFCKICEAVGFAHRNTVLHKDLKPDNIFIDKDKTPKLLDFGISSFLNPETGMMETQTQRNSGYTLLYASPEQIQGNMLATTSDIYSLGIILFQLITLKHPYEKADGSTLTLMEFFEQTKKPMPIPSRIVQDESLAKDLDWIVLKATQQRAEDRYATTEALRDDIQRYQQFLPISAAPPSWRYKARRLTWRYRWFFAAAMTCALLGSWFIHSINEQRKQAMAAKERAEFFKRESDVTSKFLSGILYDALGDYKNSRSMDFSDLVERTYLEYDKNKNGPKVAYIVAALLDAVGRSEESLAVTMASLREHKTENEKLFALGRLAVGAMRDSEQWADYPYLVQLLSDKAQTRTELESLAIVKSTYYLKHSAYEAIIKELEPFTSMDQPITNVRATSLNILAIAYKNTGAIDKALDTYKKSLSVDSSQSDHFQLNTHGNIVRLLKSSRRHKEAKAYLDDLLGSDGSRRFNSSTHLLDLMIMRLDYLDGEALAEQVAKIEVMLDVHNLTVSPERLLLLFSLSRNAEQNNQWDISEAYRLEALELARKLPPSFYHEPIALGNLGYFYRIRGNFELAETYLIEAIEKKRDLGAPPHKIHITLQNLAIVYAMSKRFLKAEEVFRTLYSEQKAFYASDHEDITTTLENLGHLYRDMEAFEDSLLYFEKCLQMKRTLWGEEDAKTIEARYLVAKAHTRLEEWEKALAVCQAAREVSLKQDDYPSRQAVKVNDLLVDILVKLNRQDEAKTMRCNDYEAYRSKWGSDHQRTKKVKAGCDQT